MAFTTISGNFLAKESKRAG